MRCNQNNSARRLHTYLFCSVVLSAPLLENSLAFNTASHGFISHTVKSRVPVLEMSTISRFDSDIAAMEKEVVASTKANIDLKRVTDALDSSTDLESDPETAAILAEPWKISAAAAVTASCAAFYVTNNAIVSAIALVGVFFAANGDPVEQDGIVGPSARVLGRATIKSVESSKPKLKAIARAAIADETSTADATPQMEHLMRENRRLERSIQQLEAQNQSLTLWKQRRELVDQYLMYYSMPDLQEKARQNNISIAGTKAQLLMALVERGIVDLP